MATKIIWTEESQRWLKDIFDFIAVDNPAAADETVQGIYNQVQSLVEFPHMGQRYWGSKREVRMLLYGHYRIAYLIKHDSDINILGVFHGALDISKYTL